MKMAKLGMMTAFVVAAALGSAANAAIIDVTLDNGAGNAIDNFLYTNSSGALNNFGANTTMSYYDLRTTSLHTARPIIQGDLPVLPGGATVVSATLELYQYTWSLGADAQFTLHQILVPWDELTSNWNDASAGTPWSAPGMAAGVDYAAAAAATATSGIANNGSYVSWDITALVTAWYGGAPNYGVRMNGPLGDVAAGDPRDGVAGFNTSENSSFKPHLIINYVPEPASLSLLLCGGLVMMGRRK